MSAFRISRTHRNSNIPLHPPTIMCFIRDILELLEEGLDLRGRKVGVALGEGLGIHDGQWARGWWDGNGAYVNGAKIRN